MYKADPLNQSLKLLISQRSLKVVVLDRYYDICDNPQAKALFSKIIELKIKGYRKEYPYGVLPVDSGDFFGVHVLLCEEKEGELNPIMGFKSVFLSRCKTFHLPFPAFHILPKNGATEHAMVMRSIISEAENNSEEVAYNASWTISPAERENPEIRNLCRSVTTFLLIQFYESYGIPNVIAGAAVRFRADKIQEFVGFSYLKDKLGKPLDTIPCESFFNEEVAVMQLREIRAEAKEWAKQFEFLWEQRIVLSEKTISSEKAVA